MEYKLVALDFDGTLRAQGRADVSPAVVKALKAVQKVGVKVAIATGRSFGGLPKRMLNGLKPDYYVCANGAQILDAQGGEIAVDQWNQEEMYALVDWCENYENALCFNYKDAYYAYVEYEAMRDFYQTATGDSSIIRDGEDQDRHLEGMPFGAFVIIDREQAAAFQEKYGYLGLDFYFYFDHQADVVHHGMTKAKGLEILLEQTGLSREQLVAVGDGSNDAAMLEFAGLGVAMGNANPEAKAAADMICGKDTEDGVAGLCRQLFPQAF